MYAVYQISESGKRVVISTATTAFEARSDWGRVLVANIMQEKTVITGFGRLHKPRFVGEIVTLADFVVGTMYAYRTCPE